MTIVKIEIHGPYGHAILRPTPDVPGVVHAVVIPNESTLPPEYHRYLVRARDDERSDLAERIVLTLDGESIGVEVEKIYNLITAFAAMH